MMGVRWFFFFGLMGGLLTGIVLQDIAFPKKITALQVVQDTKGDKIAPAKLF